MRRFCVGLEGFTEGARLLDGRGLGAGIIGHRARRARRRTEVLWQDLDKVGGEQADGPPVTPETARPPRAIAGVQALNQVALDEAEIAF